MSLLAVENLNLSIGTEEKIVNGSFAVASGDVVLLTGPNGCGKSTVIKLIMGATFDYSDLDCSGSSIIFRNSHDILNSERENEDFRKRVCYVSQEDEFESCIVLDCFVNSVSNTINTECERYVFDFIKQFNIADCFGFANDSAKLDRKAMKLIRKLALNLSELTEEDIKAIKYLSMDTRHMSGGQKKLTNIFSNLIRYAFCELIILDEPLNNLDYGNVRNFSNVLSMIYKCKQDIAIIIVTHCRSIPIINRIIEIDPQNKTFREGEVYQCSSCFGVVNAEGLYI